MAFGIRPKHDIRENGEKDEKRELVDDRENPNAQQKEIDGMKERIAGAHSEAELKEIAREAGSQIHALADSVEKTSQTLRTTMNTLLAKYREWHRLATRNPLPKDYFASAEKLRAEIGALEGARDGLRNDMKILFPVALPTKIAEDVALKVKQEGYWSDAWTRLKKVCFKNNLVLVPLHYGAGDNVRVAVVEVDFKYGDKYSRFSKNSADRKVQTKPKEIPDPTAEAPAADPDTIAKVLQLLEKLLRESQEPPQAPQERDSQILEAA